MKIEELFSVRGKVAVVTGGSRGLGEMIARAYVENGVKVYITARRAEACEQLAKELSEIGECIAIPADLSRMEEIDRFAGEIEKREKQARHSRQQCRRQLGRELSRVSGEWLGQGHGPECQVRFLPDAALNPFSS